MKKILLAGTALAGATMLASGAQAQDAMMSPSIGDNMSVSIGGNLRVSYLIFDQDDDFGRERGYRIASDESEIAFKASNTADNGLSYGFEIELHTQTNDSANSDETWMFLDGGETWGRVEMGDQDSAGDRMFVDGADAMAGRGGYDGAVGDVFKFGGTNTAIDPDGISEVRFGGPGFNLDSDATKIIYFTPRFAGFQFGASFTPDGGNNGGNGISDNAGQLEDVFSVGVNFSNTFNDITVTAGLAAEFADEEDDGTTPAERNPSVYGGGLKIDYAGFSVAGGYVERTDNGFDGSDDRWIDFGISYKTGPWKVGGGYFFSENDISNDNNEEVEVNIFSVGANYNVAPGFDIATDINFVSVDDVPSIGAGDPDSSNAGTVFVLSTIMSF